MTVGATLRTKIDHHLEDEMDDNQAKINILKNIFDKEQWTQPPIGHLDALSALNANYSYSNSTLSTTEELDLETPCRENE